jgi:hypothetical protein
MFCSSYFIAHLFQKAIFILHRHRSLSILLSSAQRRQPKIVQLLRLYDQNFSVQHAPYLISYATYVAATIHVRIAAQRESGSEAHAGLSTCLLVFEKNQETNRAVRRARTVILNLMKRMNVTIPKESNIHDLDIDNGTSVRASRGMSIGQSN